MKRIHTLLLAGMKYVFAVSGAAMLAVAAYQVVDTRAFLAAAVRAEGVVVDLARSRSSDSGSSSSSATYAPVIRFVARDGREVEFVSSHSSNPPRYRRGDRVGLLYAPDAPERARLEGFFSVWFGALIAGLLGTVFLLVGGGWLFFEARARRRRGDLRANGVRVEADLVGVEDSRDGEAGASRLPFRIVSQWRDPSTSKIHVFTSEDIWFDPTAYVDRERIPVLIDRRDPGRYLVDLSFLPQRAE